MTPQPAVAFLPESEFLDRAAHAHHTLIPGSVFHPRASKLPLLSRPLLCYCSPWDAERGKGVYPDSSLCAIQR